MVELTVEHVEDTVPVTILALVGKLDATNYEQVIARGHELYAAGVRRLLIDLEKLVFMGSSGLVALHTVTLLLLGQQPPDREAGWAGLHAMDGAAQQQQAVKLLNPQPKIRQMLVLTGMDEHYAIFTDREAALASFQQAL